VHGPQLIGRKAEQEELPDALVLTRAGEDAIGARGDRRCGSCSENWWLRWRRESHRRRTGPVSPVPSLQTRWKDASTCATRLTVASTVRYVRLGPVLGSSMTAPIFEDQ
jgi:hypothetical protein